MKSYIKLNSYGYDSELDTGWGNRFLTWKFSYLLNQFNNFKFDLVVGEKHKWPELEYIDIPHLKTYEVDDDCEILENEIRVLDKTKNWLMRNEIFYSIPTAEEFYNIFMKDLNIPKLDIKLKDKKLDSIIRKKLKNSVGIHIRFKRWKSTKNKKLGSICDYERNPKPLFDYCDSLLKNVDNFYISTDLIKRDLPNLKNSNNNFLSEFYNRYETIDYSDICEVNNKTMRDVIDLYSLIYCDTFIMGQSTWTGFVEEYRKELNKNKNHMIEMEYINAANSR